jgi:hypothetical protein
VSFKITGLDELQKVLEQASRAFESLDGEIANLQFNPMDPSSVAAAITDMEQAIDGRLAPYRGNVIVENLATELKTKYRDHILDRAAEARARKEEGRTPDAPTVAP